jgi:hypothetical protein
MGKRSLFFVACDAADRSHFASPNHQVVPVEEQADDLELVKAAVLHVAGFVSGDLPLLAAASSNYIALPFLTESDLDQQ